MFLLKPLLCKSKYIFISKGPSWNSVYFRADKPTVCWFKKQKKFALVLVWENRQKNTYINVNVLKRCMVQVCLHQKVYIHLLQLVNTARYSYVRQCVLAFSPNPICLIFYSADWSLIPKIHCNTQNLDLQRINKANHRSMEEEKQLSLTQLNSIVLNRMDYR